MVKKKEKEKYMVEILYHKTNDAYHREKDSFHMDNFYPISIAESLPITMENHLDMILRILEFVTLHCCLCHWSTYSSSYIPRSPVLKRGAWRCNSFWWGHAFPSLHYRVTRTAGSAFSCVTSVGYNAGSYASHVFDIKVKEHILWDRFFFSFYFFSLSLS